MTGEPADIADVMPRGAGRRTRDRDGPERRCIATGESGAPDRMIRFVVAPDAVLTPDLSARLPGRGVWLTAERARLDDAIRRKAFHRGFKRAVTVPEGLGDLIERLLADRLIDLVSMARKAGHAVTGFEKVRAELTARRAGVLVQASDAAADGRERLRRIGQGVPVIDLLDRTELGLAFGREFAIHAALAAGGFADRVSAEAARLRGFRHGMAATGCDPGWAQRAGDDEDDQCDDTGEPQTGSRQDGS